MHIFFSQLNNVLTLSLTFDLDNQSSLYEWCVSSLIKMLLLYNFSQQQFQLLTRNTWCLHGLETLHKFFLTNYWFEPPFKTLKNMCLWNTDAPGGNKVKIWQKLRKQSQNMAKISKSYILTPPQPQGHGMSQKCEELIVELTVQVW